MLQMDSDRPLCIAITTQIISTLQIYDIGNRVLCLRLYFLYFKHQKPYIFLFKLLALFTWKSCDFCPALFNNNTFFQAHSLSHYSFSCYQSFDSYFS